MGAGLALHLAPPPRLAISGDGEMGPSCAPGRLSLSPVSSPGSTGGADAHLSPHVETVTFGLLRLVLLSDIQKSVTSDGAIPSWSLPTPKRGCTQPAASPAPSHLTHLHWADRCLPPGGQGWCTPFPSWGHFDGLVLVVMTTASRNMLELAFGEHSSCSPWASTCQRLQGAG